KFKKDSNEETTSQVVSDTSVTAGGETQPIVTDAVTTDTVTSVAATTAAAQQNPETTTASEVADSKALLGSWSDGAGMSGFEFFDNGTVKITYVNVTIPLINIPVNGTYNGTYTVNGDEITMSFSIYTATITNKYRFEISNSQLTLTNLEDMKNTVYIRTFAEETTSAPETTTAEPVSSSYNSELAGSWVCGDSGITYKFGNDGEFSVKYSNASVSGVPAGTYEGIYIFDGDTLTVQYTVSDSRKTEKYSCIQSKNSLTVTDNEGNSFIFVREGTGSVSASDASELIGKWLDGAGMSGYEFHEDGLVTATYVNLNIPVVNIPINGTYDGAYSVSGDSLTVSFSIYGRVIRRSFTFSVDGNTLTLTDSGDGKKSIYIKK
ncbi:MAG: hypothetical protein MJ177_10750, partial [Clostridia bacterium]|nr:hypothetical protein [Clostridia bacterium]